MNSGVWLEVLWRQEAPEKKKELEDPQPPEGGGGGEIYINLNVRWHFFR